MSEQIFPILGTTTAQMIGRDAVMQRLYNNLTKTTPSHLSIVGPRFAGKTVLIKNLKERLSTDDSPYNVVIYWDLGHLTPSSDEEFISQLSGHISQGIKNIHPDDATLLQGDIGDVTYSDLREVLSACNDEGTKILMLWDGFDRPLSSDVLTRNLWDQLKELALIPSLRLVTASRRPLSELIRSAESATSDFWGVFDTNPVKIDTLNEDDIKAIYAKVGHINFNNSATKELINWSGSFPPLFLELINQICSNGSTNIDNETVNNIADNAMSNLIAIIDYLWHDCSVSARSQYRYLVEHGEQSISTINHNDIIDLESRGFIQSSSGKKVRACCKLLEKYIATLDVEIGSLARLFSTKEDYQNNIKGVLELHLEHVNPIDSILKRSIQSSINDIPEYPVNCITNIRNIVDKSLDLIWKVEFPDREISRELLHDWKIRGEKGPDKWSANFPLARGHQVGLLQLITGTAKTARRSKNVTKNTAVLVNSLHGIGDFGQHLDGTDVSLGIAISAVTLSIELAEILSKEL